MSSLDKIVEQIAFGKETPAPAPSLGLYLSPETIYLSETHAEKDGRLVVDHLVRIPIPVEGKTLGVPATMNTEFLSDPLKVAGLIRQSMSQLRWNTKNVRVTLSHHLGLLRYFTMPPMERRFLKSAVPLEAKKTIPIPFDALAYDYRAEPLPPDAAGKQKLGVLIAVTQKKNLANVQGLVEALGLKLQGVEVAPCAVLRLWSRVDPVRDAAPFLHVHMDGGSVRIMVVHRGVPIFFREVFLNQEASVDDLRKIDLPGCLGFVQKQLGVSGISRLRVSGNLAALEAMKDAFAQETGLSASIQDTPRLLSVKSGDWGGYAALGASIHSLAPAEAVLDLAAKDRVTEEEKQTARDIMLAGAGLAAALAVMGLIQSASYTFRVRELRRYQHTIDPDIAASLQGMDPTAIDVQLKEMQSQLDQLRPVNSVSHPKLSEIIKDVIEVMPEKVWLDHVNVEEPLLAAEKQPLTLTLIGHAQGQTVQEEQDLAFHFKEEVIRQPVLGKIFNVEVSVQKAAGSDAIDTGAPGMDPKTFAEKLEQRTQFTLILKARS